MNAAAIKEHLKMLMELEKEVYTQNQVIASLEYQLSCLPDAHRYTRPVYTEANSNYQISGLTWLCFGSALIFLLLAPVSDAIINSDWGIMGLLLFPILLIFYLARSFAIPCAIFLFAAGIIVFFVERNNQSDARYAAKQQSKKSYETAMATYNRAVEQDRLRVERERPKKLLLQGQLKTLKDAHKKTVDTLNKLYNKGVIHKKYWGLVPICSLYGYFDTGVCTQLEGHEGAYNKYDTECRLDRIISKLDQVIQRLDEIKALQQDLYEAIEESNCKVGQLIRNSERISDQLTGIQSQGAELNARIANLQTTSDINLYVNACAKRELEYMNRANRIFQQINRRPRIPGGGVFFVPTSEPAFSARSTPYNKVYLIFYLLIKEDALCCKPHPRPPRLCFRPASPATTSTSATTPSWKKS